MKQTSGAAKPPADEVVRDIRRTTRRQFSAEEEIRIVLEGLRGEESIAEPCRREGIASSPGHALILLRDLKAASRAPAPDLLRRLFGLTPAEAEVACALYGGASKSAVAAKRGLRESTIRSQADAILLKTGTR
jgi:DNA-binding NarL/FixJ family response regulator